MSGMADMYPTLNITHIDGTKYTVQNVYKAMRVRNFKWMVGMEIKTPGSACGSLQLVHLGEEMDDSRTLESYGLDKSSVIRVVPVDDPSSAKKGVGGLKSALKTKSPPTQTQSNLVAAGGEKIGDAFAMVDDRTLLLEGLTMDMQAEDVLGLLSKKTGINAEYMRIIYGGKQLREGTGITLRDYGITKNLAGQECTMHVVTRVRGGRVE
ncbi:hypothetical protein PV04_07966 [Phialophora macrospora]|uniref:Ubiquitin-like domain-containing protein n=1 Tax=Phialophora macrospora TaxID=1851006 RepID=A0A0D2FG03_9EURO|nr:hypothetical protein PV04_07966 [Phialophora macrospora]